MKIGKQPCKRCFHYFLKAFNLHWFQSNSCTATRSYLEAFQWIFYPVRNFFKGKHCWFVAEFVRWFKYTCSAHEKTVKALEENEEFWSLTRLEKHYKMSPGKSFFALTRTCVCLSFFHESSPCYTVEIRMNSVLEYCNLAEDLTGKFAACVLPHVFPLLFADDCILFVFIL